MENQGVKKVFRSRISILMLGFILAIFVPCTIPMIKHMVIPGLWTMGGTFLFMILLFGGMRYIVSDGKLYVKIWIIPSGSVEISNIISVERSYNLLSVACRLTQKAATWSGRESEISVYVDFARQRTRVHRRTEGCQSRHLCSCS